MLMLLFPDYISTLAIDVLGRKYMRTLHVSFLSSESDDDKKHELIEEMNRNLEKISSDFNQVNKAMQEYIANSLSRIV